MPSVIKPPHPPSTTAHSSPDLSSRRSLLPSSSSGLAIPSTPARGQIWQGGRRSNQDISLLVLVMNGSVRKASPRRMVLDLQPCEPDFEGEEFRFALRPTAVTGLQQLAAVDAETCRSMHVEYLTRYVGRIDAELLQDIRDAVGLAMELF